MFLTITFKKNKNKTTYAELRPEFLFETNMIKEGEK